MSPCFPFLLLGLCVCVCVCFRKSCFVLPAALAWFHFAFPSLSPSLLPPPPFLWGDRGCGFLECHKCPSLCSPHPETLPPPGVSVECPPTTLELHRGSHLFRGSLLERGLPAPLPSSAAGVASCHVAWWQKLWAELGLLGAWRQRPVLGTFKPVVGSHLAAACILSLPVQSFGEPFRRVVTQPPGPRQSSQTPATLVATVPVALRPMDVLLSPEIGSLGF